MLLDYFTYGILIAASAYALYKAYRAIFPGKEVTAGCGHGCNCDDLKQRKQLLGKR